MKLIALLIISTTILTGCGRGSESSPPTPINHPKERYLLKDTDIISGGLSCILFGKVKPNQSEQAEKFINNNGWKIVGEVDGALQIRVAPCLSIDDVSSKRKAVESSGYFMDVYIDEIYNPGSISQ